MNCPRCRGIGIKAVGQNGWKCLSCNYDSIKHFYELQTGDKGKKVGSEVKPSLEIVGDTSSTSLQPPTKPVGDPAPRRSNHSSLSGFLMFLVVTLFILFLLFLLWLFVWSKPSSNATESIGSKQQREFNQKNDIKVSVPEGDKVDGLKIGMSLMDVKTSLGYITPLASAFLNDGFTDTYDYGHIVWLTFKNNELDQIDYLR